MRKILLIAIITVAVVQCFAIADLSMRHENVYGRYNWIAGWIFFFMGAILCSFPKVRETGKGILIGSGILLVIRFATCNWNS
jgi:hypothetical protein